MIGFFRDCLVHTKGPFAGQPFHLLPWQVQIVRELFGWRREDGTRRYRRVYIIVPRKNGKSTFAAGLALWMLLCEGEKGCEVYSAASTRDQSALVYSMAADMIRQGPDPALRKAVQIKDSFKRMITRNGFYRAISADSKGAHGFNASCIVVDELHVCDRKLIEVLETSTGARTQPLMICITTAGHDRSSVCWEWHQYAIKVQQGLVRDDAFLPVIFSADPDDDWTDENVWAKVNPCLGDAISLSYLREQCDRAKENPAAENTFRRLHLCQWTEAETRAIQMANWDNCKQDFTAEDMQGRKCFGGLDLASTQDVTALSLVFPHESGCRVLPFFWMPRDHVNARGLSDRKMIMSFAERGLVEITEGNEVDQAFLCDRIMEILQQYDVGYLGYDPWNSVGVTQRLKEMGLPGHVLIKMPQTIAVLNEPFKTLLSWIGSKKFQHDGNEVLRWMAANTVAWTDASGNIRPDKRRSAEKIDGIVATILGVALSTRYGADDGAYTSKESLVFF